MMSYRAVCLDVKLWVKAEGNSVESCRERRSVTQWVRNSESSRDNVKLPVCDVEHLWFPGCCCRPVCPRCPCGGCVVCDSVCYEATEGAGCYGDESDYKLKERQTQAIKHGAMLFLSCSVPVYCISLDTEKQRACFESAPISVRVVCTRKNDNMLRNKCMTVTLCL